MSSTANTSPAGSQKSGGNRLPFLAFVSDEESASLLRQFATAQGWNSNVIFQGDIKSATEYLKSNPSPHVLCVDIPSAEEAPTLLDRLADVCDPSIKVIVSGKINEYSFYCWLVEVGISNYLLKPFTPASIEAAYRKATDVAGASATQAVQEAKKEAQIIAVIGARGGVGATTVSVNMAWILANTLQQRVALLDFDPQLGTVALALDLEPSKGLRDALEKPDRIDSLFIDRVMVKVDDNLSILSTEESIEDSINASEAAAEALFLQIKPKFSHVIVDVPRTLSPFTRYAITHADHVICVTEYTIMGLREALRYRDYFRDVLKIRVPLFVSNRVGLAGKHQMPQSEFEKGLDEKMAYTIPFVLDAYAATNAGQILVETSKNASASKAMTALASHFVEGHQGNEPQSKLKGLLALLKGGK